MLKERGYRLTPQRLMVVDAVHNSERHVSAEEIFEQVRSRYPYANISTVYRTLELLKDEGLVVETDLGEGRLKYHHAEKGHHHHLVCRICGENTEIPESALEEMEKGISSQTGFRAEFRHLAITGICAKCHKQGGGNPRRTRSHSH